MELLVAMSIGLVVAGTMFAVFRAVAATANRVSRMSQENQALRSGLLAVCEQNVDFWVDVDDPQGDPGDPRPGYLGTAWNQSDTSKPIDGNGGQGLRGFDVTRASAGENWCTGSKQGLPFTPFEWLRDLTEFGDGTLRLFQPSATAAAGTEQETGWDRNYHWAAADERTWFHGDAGAHVPTVPVTSSTYLNAGTVQETRRLQFGRYAIISNPNATAHLTAGYTDSSFGSIDPRRLWRERMLLSLVNGIGYYGIAEYLPLNAIYGTHGAEFLKSDDTTIRSDNRSVRPLPTTSAEAPTPCWFFSGTVSGGGGTTWYGFPGLAGSANELFWGGQILNLGIYPASVYARDPLYTPSGGNCYFYLTSRAKNQAQVRTTGLVSVHRDNDARINHSGPIYHGPKGNYEGRDFMKSNMATVKRPLLIQRPATWPEVLVGTSRVLWGSMFMNTNQVRWSDPVTGRFQSITFNAFGSSLRGARQQRRLPTSYADVGGWARWLEPWNLRQQRKVATPADPWAAVPNDRCLDDYADAADLDPEFKP